MGNKNSFRRQNFRIFFISQTKNQNIIIHYTVSTAEKHKLGWKKTISSKLMLGMGNETHFQIKLYDAVQPNVFANLTLQVDENMEATYL